MTVSSLLYALAIAAIPALGVVSLVHEANPHAFDPAPKTLLVAVAALDGQARAVKLLPNEAACIDTARAMPAGLERFECRAPK